MPGSQARRSTAVRRPRQARSRRTLERLLRAAEELIAERGPGAVTVPEIVRRAGSSVGSFYARFDGKEALLRHLEDRAAARIREGWARALDPDRFRGASLAAVTRELVRMLVRAHRKHEDRLRALGLRACLQPAGTTARSTAELNRDVLAGAVSLLGRWRDEIGHPDPELAIGFGLQTVLGVLRDRTLLGPAGWSPLELPDRRLIEELSRAWTAYLRDGARPGRR